ncbi:hypothetical protein BLNAU_12583 [Blattamonas nauphoetae]|uniref:Uncharacterized protein n=1 Tax=Blattamonas nauphoetae TaxID=2049346 RepID=A0ABQ9XJ65_9EUKA|nr:hypothetical protein BLNAU_12583 [Blattamonas nauphoetae]
MTPQKKENEKKKEIREEIDQILLELTNEFSGLEYSGSDSDEQGPIPQTPTCVQRDDTKPTPSKIRDSPVKSISFPLLDADTEPQTSPIIHPQISSADVDIVPLNKNSNKSHENEQQKRENRRISVQNRLERIKNALDSLSDEPAGKAEDKLTFQQESHVTHPIPPAFIPEQRFSPPIPSPPVTPSPTVPLQTVFRFGDQPPTFQSSRTLHPTSTPLRSLPTPSIPMSSRPPSLFTPKLIFDSPSPNDDLFITHRRSHTPSIDHDDSLSDDNQLDNTHHHTVNTLPLNRPPHNTFPTPSTFPPSAPIPVTPSPEPLPRPYLNTTPTTSRLFRAQETHKSPDPLRQVKTDRGGPGGWEESERLLGKSVHSLLSSQRHNTQQRELEREKEREEHLRRMKREEVESHHKEQEDETRPQNFEEEHDRASTREEEDEEKAETSPEDEEPSEREAKEEEEGEGENDEEEDIQEEEEGDPDEKREEEGDPGEEMEEEEENEELEPEDKFEEDENLSQQSSPIHHSPILFTPNTPPSFSRNHPHSPTTLSQSSPSILSTTTPHTQPLSRFAILKQKTEQLQNRLRQLGTDEDRPTTSKPRAERKSEEHWRVELRMLLEDRKKEREIREEDEEKRRFEEEQRQADNETRSELIRKERRELESQQHAMRQEVARTEKIEETIREESAEREKKGKALFKLQSPTTDAQMRLSQLMKSLR